VAGTEGGVSTSCSFCLKPSRDVAKLVAGPGVYICDECVELCRQIISNPPSLPPELTSWEQGLDVDGVLASLPRMAAAGAQVESNLTRFVKRARELGATWAAIGSSLGITRVGVGAILWRRVVSRPVPASVVEGGMRLLRCEILPPNARAATPTVRYVFGAGVPMPQTQCFVRRPGSL